MIKSRLLKLVVLLFCMAVAAGCTPREAAQPTAEANPAPVEEPTPEIQAASHEEAKSNSSGGFQIASGEIQLVEFTAAW